MIQKVYNSKGFQSSIPYITLTLGIILLVFGIFGPIESDDWRELLKAAGKSILAGGIFAILLKAIQFMGVFKEELAKVIYEPKHLSVREDLPELWEKMSTVLFKDKFPLISNKLLKDVKEIYFPTKEVSYYDNTEHIIELKIIDKENCVIQLVVTSSMNVICESKDTKTIYEFGHSKDEKSRHTITKFSIDGDGAPQYETASKQIGGTEYEISKVHLTGKEKYAIEKVVERNLHLNDDNVSAFHATKIFSKLKVQIHHDPEIELEFNKAGTLRDYQVKKQRHNFKEYYYEGLIYPQQGYYLTLRLNHNL